MLLAQITNYITSACVSVLWNVPTGFFFFKEMRLSLAKNQLENLWYIESIMQIGLKALNI